MSRSVPPYPRGRALLAGKTVLVTAAAGTGIGFATAKRCAEEGARVMLSDLHERRLRELVFELELILIQIANLETTGDLEAVDLIRDTVSNKEVLLKINLEKMRSTATDLPKPGACDA